MLTNIVRNILPTYGYSVPSREEVLAELERTKYTPDISKLEEHPWVPVFVADELKKNHIKHDLLGGEKHFAGPAYTRKLYRFWDKRSDPTQSPVPMKVIDKENGFVRFFPPPARIKGEVWWVRPEAMLTLDTYKQNTVEYRRQQVEVIVPYLPQIWLKDPYRDPGETRSGYRPTTKLGHEMVHIYRPWFYLGRRVFWEPHLTAFDFTHVSLFKSERHWCQQFYHVKRPKS